MSDKFTGSSEGGEATVEVWPNAGGEISVWIEEEAWKEGKGVYLTNAIASLPPSVALALGQKLIEIASDRSSTDPR